MGDDRAAPQCLYYIALHSLRMQWRKGISPCGQTKIAGRCVGDLQPDFCQTCWGAAVCGGLGGWPMAVLPFHLFWILLPFTECNYVNTKSTNKLHRRSGGEKLASVWHCFSFQSPHLLQMGRLSKQNC